MIDCVFFISLSHYQAAAIVEYGGRRFDSCPRNYMALKKCLFCLVLAILAWDISALLSS
jgi:hypothetical protein